MVITWPSFYLNKIKSQHAFSVAHKSFWFLSNFPNPVSLNLHSYTANINFYNSFKGILLLVVSEDKALRILISTPHSHIFSHCDVVLWIAAPKYLYFRHFYGFRWIMLGLS